MCVICNDWLVILTCVYTVPLQVLNLELKYTSSWMCTVSGVTVVDQCVSFGMTS